MRSAAVGFNLKPFVGLLPLRHKRFISDLRLPIHSRYFTWAEFLYAQAKTISWPEGTFRTRDAFAESACLAVFKIFFAHCVLQWQVTISKALLKHTSTLLKGLWDKHSSQSAVASTVFDFVKHFLSVWILKARLSNFSYTGRRFLLPADGGVSGAADPLHVQGTDVCISSPTGDPHHRPFVKCREGQVHWLINAMEGKPRQSLIWWSGPISTNR